MSKRKGTRYIGVCERISEKRTHNGKPDVCFDIDYRVNGRLKWEKAGWLSEGYSAKLASQIRSERLRNIRHGEELPKKKKIPMFKDIATEYLKWATENKARNGYDDSNLYKNHLSHRFDDKQLDQISAFDLEKMKIEILQKGLSRATAAHCLKLFRQMVNKALMWGKYQGENPVKGVKIPTLNNQRQRFLSFEEANLLLAELRKVSKQSHDMAFLSLYCGVRAGEIFNLKMQDLDLENGLINISDPKNRESRKAYMTTAIKEILSDYYTPESLNEYVFKDRRHGGKIRWLSGAFGRVVEKLGLNKGVEDSRQRITFHSLRHTFASWLAMQGESLITLRDLLGHKNTQMTNRYAHLSPDHKKAAVLRLEETFNRRLTQSKEALI
ncbi:MAG: tyrosine-type recombinase/integrase [Pseudomonadota bacterium]